ncbi:MAG TPA: aldo/keto reductase [Candidatus Sulfotelmatobacter sp.]|nr:aldo/keto reductase [Candidatus Sulfotelmatobacter sp.]
MSLSGAATAEGTLRFSERYPEAASGHFRHGCGWTVSSIGVGTYLGEPDEAVDAGYAAAIETAVDMGCNVIDTAIVYRNQRSERVVGRTLDNLAADGKCARDEIVISTKGGFLAYDSEYPRGPRAYIEETLLRPGIISVDDVVGGAHCMTPRYLRSQLDLSRGNLGCEAVDIYFLHNPESQLAEVDRAEFLRRIRDAFAFLEEAVSAGEISVYGTATWSGYRTSSRSPDFLALEDLLQAARDAGGDSHHFRALQLPVNLAMPEGITVANQPWRGTSSSLLAAAADSDLVVFASASLMQARLTRDLPLQLRTALGASSDAQAALQFVRSAPGVTTALVGMSNPAHVVENCALVSTPPLDRTRFGEMLG